MRKYKINRETDKEQLPSDEAINKHKDFNSLQVRYNDLTKKSKVPLYKNRKMFLFLVIVALAAWLISEAMEEDDKTQDKDKQEQSK